MVRFIMLSMAVVVLSFAFAPVFSGISKEHQALTAADQTQNVASDTTLSFEEIYQMAENAAQDNPEFLNNILPAAGEGVEDKFSLGFRAKEDSALENSPRSSTEEDIL